MQRFSYEVITLRSAYNEFGYNEHPAITDNFLTTMFIVQSPCVSGYYKHIKLFVVSGIQGVSSFTYDEQPHTQKCACGTQVIVTTKYFELCHRREDSICKVSARSSGLLVITEYVRSRTEYSKVGFISTPNKFKIKVEPPFRDHQCLKKFERKNETNSKLWNIKRSPLRGGSALTTVCRGQSTGLQ